ncbi:hydrophobic surface binding protein A-domain-containing protein [Xylaria sp. FL0064]|nr:hydrophobic surface binding protein A-domain-containing protein [Xylaria sp. FL0064]
MKTTTFLALACTAAAELQLYSYPTPVKRDLATVTSVVAQISSAITQLDISVKAFDTDGSQVQSDAANLVSTIKDGAESIASSGGITLEDALGLQDVATQLSSAGQTLLTDLQSKKAEFEASGLCGDVQSTIKSIGSEVQSFVDSVVKQLPADAQDVASQLTSGISAALSSGAASFQCASGDATSSAAAATSAAATSTLETPTDAVADTYPTSALETSSAAATVTVTVTAPCACESSSSSIPILTPTTTVLYPTGSNSTSIIPTGGVTTTSASTIPTAGAAVNGVGAVGLMAGLAAALLV